ncbi:MAG: hypothetical protein LWX09_02360 [Bacteroidia bacterium]|nr:hypothetical protein [Bacteroidia bacterium]
MKTLRIVPLTIAVLISLNVASQELVAQTEKKSGTLRINGALGAGTFAAGENMGGSAFLGGSLSADWMPNKNNGLTYGLETGILGGKTQNKIIYGFPALFRLGWHPNLGKNEKIDCFALLKTGWGFGIWGSQIESNSQPNGIAGGFTFGGTYLLSRHLGLYSELGYIYYGLARSSNHPEYPLGYGSGKLYMSIGLSLNFNNNK